MMPKKIQINVRLTPVAKKAVQRLARLHNRSVSTMIEVLILKASAEAKLENRHEVV